LFDDNLHYFVRAETDTVLLTPNSHQEHEVEVSLEKKNERVYSRGDIVWAKINGYSFWPAMIDDDPDYKVCFWPEDASITMVSFYRIVLLFFSFLSIENISILFEICFSLACRGITMLCFSTQRIVFRDLGASRIR